MMQSAVMGEKMYVNRMPSARRYLELFTCALIKKHLCYIGCRMNLLSGVWALKFNYLAKKVLLIKLTAAIFTCFFENF